MQMALSFEYEIKVPNHLAIILDGNGRWALSKGLSRSLGHTYGAKTLKEIISYAFSLNVKVLSLYCFSTENFKRDKQEITHIFDLFTKYLKDYQDEFIKNDIKVIFSGDLSKLPQALKLACESISLKSKNCSSHIINFCINYGFKDELVKAVKAIAYKVKNDNLNIESINQMLIEEHFYSKGLPDIDLLIRTSNELRLSNFMLYQASYAELYFVKKFWPAFNKKDLHKAFVEFAKRKRRFGGV